jgi:HNH endonuclease
MSDIASSLRAQVTQRAGGRCEYCRLSQVGQEAVFHIDHVIPRAAGGSTTLDNLALACVSCSLRKWAKQKAIDTDTDKEVPLFNPRKDTWAEHFRWEGERVVSLTPTGRATTAALALNRPLILAIRHEETTRGRHPPM